VDRLPGVACVNGGLGGVGRGRLLRSRRPPRRSSDGNYFFRDRLEAVCRGRVHDRALMDRDRRWDVLCFRVHCIECRN